MFKVKTKHKKPKKEPTVVVVPSLEDAMAEYMEGTTRLVCGYNKNKYIKDAYKIGVDRRDFFTRNSKQIPQWEQTEKFIIELFNNFKEIDLRDAKSLLITPKQQSENAIWCSSHGKWTPKADAYMAKQKRKPVEIKHVGHETGIYNAYLPGLGFDKTLLGEILSSVEQYNFLYKNYGEYWLISTSEHENKKKVYVHVKRIPARECIRVKAHWRTITSKEGVTVKVDRRQLRRDPKRGNNYKWLLWNNYKKLK